MARSSWAWANEQQQGPKKSVKKTHEHHNNDAGKQKYKTQTVKLSEN